MKVLLRSVFAQSIMVTLLQISHINAQNTLVTIAENPAQTSSSLQNTQVFSFDTLSRGRHSNVQWADVGSFDQLYISRANVYGGAPNESGSLSQFSAQGGRWIDSSTLSLNQSSSYFGMWWSAGDHNDQLSFYSGDDLVSRYTTNSLLRNLNLNADYYGNPVTGGNTREPYAFINFYGDANTSWDRIVMTQTSPGGGFESDNYTTRVESFNPEADGAEALGTVVSQVSGTETTEVSEPLETWVWRYEDSAPGAPTPTIYALFLFLGMLLLRDKLHPTN